MFVQQPPCFEKIDYPDHVCKLEKALFELNQAPRAWYGRFSKFHLSHGYSRNKIDNTLFSETNERIYWLLKYIFMTSYLEQQTRHSQMNFPNSWAMRLRWTWWRVKLIIRASDKEIIYRNIKSPTKLHQGTTQKIQNGGWHTNRYSISHNH